MLFAMHSYPSVEWGFVKSKKSHDSIKIEINEQSIHIPV